MLDLLIRNARICDGTGAPSFMGELGVKDGVIRSVGPKNGQTAARVIDADGLVLAPGFVDPHTHYDAQLAWDPLVTCSPWHGVTTVVMGNCGVGVAPVKPETREILMQDLVNVEAIPYDVMKAGIDWQWESYGQYLDAVDRRGLGINVAGLVAFTPLRHYVMGEASFERAATGDEIAIMRRLLREAMEAGAFGFTTTTSRNHVGYQGRPLACRNASREELVGVVRGLHDVGRGRDRDHPELGRDVRGERRGRGAPAADHAGERAAGDLARALRASGPARLPRPDLRQARRSHQAGHPAGDAAADHEPGRSPEPDHVRLLRLLAEGVQPARGREDRALPGSRVPRRLPAGAGEPPARAHVGPDARAGSGPARAGRPRGPHPRGDRGGPGQAPGGRLLRSGPRRRPGDLLPVLHLQLRSGGRRAADRRRSLPGRALRRRGARGRHLRRGLRHRPARPLGAADRRAEPREGGAQADPGAGHRVRHSQPRRAGGGQGRRPRAVRPGDGHRQGARGT